jgi:hypothetical protein
MWKRLATGLGFGASLMLAAGCASSMSPASSSSPAPRTSTSEPGAAATGPAAGPAALPQLRLQPASGPAGTHVMISGRLSPAQVRANESYFQHPAYFSLITDVFASCANDPGYCTAGPASLAGCELIVNAVHPILSLDVATGRVSGSFTVGGDGTCFADRPTGQPQTTPPGRYDLAIGAHATSWALFTVTRSAATQVDVAACPVPAGDYAGLPYSSQPAPPTLSLSASVSLPAGAQVYGTEFLPGSTAYLVGPAAATCRGYLASADGGEIMTVTSALDRAENVTMIIRPGGAGPSTDLACPYIPAVLAADKVFRQNTGRAFCGHPAADVIRQIPTRTAGLYAAAVLVPPQVKDPGIPGSGGRHPTVALFTAAAGQDWANGQLAACTLPPGQAAVCATSLNLFLNSQAQISGRISAANLSSMTAALSSFLASQHL